MTTESQEAASREDWIARQRAHGNLPRAVLMKGLHPLVNGTIDLWHRSVMRSAFEGANGEDGTLTLDLGCGYGRLADEATACGLAPVVGLDFTQQFCVDFKLRHGAAVCAALSRLPFSDASFANAYAVTALMYLPVHDAELALLELDRCLMTGARVLVLEPSKEFNDLVRLALPWKRRETLARPGLTSAELNGDMMPAHWERLGAGANTWMTILLPALALSTGFPKVYAWLSRLAVSMDRPALAPARGAPSGGFAMYRWAVFRKP